MSLGYCINIIMINGDEYTIVLEITEKAKAIGLVIVPPEYTSSMIEPSVKSDDLFRVRTARESYPMYNSTKNIHVGNFASVEVFIRGAYFLYHSLEALGAISEENIAICARDMTLMNAIRSTGSDEDL